MDEERTFFAAVLRLLGCKANDSILVLAQAFLLIDGIELKVIRAHLIFFAKTDCVCERNNFQIRLVTALINTNVPLLS